MATYNELYDLHADSALKNRVTVAVCVAAHGVTQEDGATPNHANRLTWAAQVFANPAAEANRMFPVLLAANAAAPAAAISAAADEDILAAVNGAVDLFATG